MFVYLNILFVLIAWASDCNHPLLDQRAQAAFKVWGFHIYDIEYQYKNNYPSGPYLLELNYKKNISGRKIVKSSEDEMKKIGAPAEKLKLWMVDLGKIMPNVKPGDSLRGFVNEKKQSQFCFAGKHLGTIEDPEFADYFFGIWLNEKTSQPKLRARLLQKEL